MVVTRLREVTNKGKEWATTTTSTGTTAAASSSSSPSGSDGGTNASVASSASSSYTNYWDYASNSIQDATASAVGSMVSSFFGSEQRVNAFPQEDQSEYGSSTTQSSLFSRYKIPTALDTSSTDSSIVDPADSKRSTTPSHVRRSSLSNMSPWNKTPHSDLLWMFRHNKNPYNAVRGRDTHPSALTAVRSLVALVPTSNRGGSGGGGDNEALALQSRRQSVHHHPSLMTVDEVDDAETSYDKVSPLKHVTSGSATLEDASNVLPPPYVMHRDDSLVSNKSPSSSKQTKTLSSASETASQLAEGSIRALRDLALDEAIELQAALRFWNNRWERPLLSWLEAGPLVWTSPQGYNHQDIGRKVSQLQAVLARRCAGIGELQCHLLRAGWHRGVAQWGVLGQGGQWAPVTGFDGTMNEFQFGGTADKASNEDVEDPFSPEVSVRKIPGLPLPLHRRHHSDSEAAMMDELATIDKQQPPTLADSVLSEDPIPTTHIGGSDIVQQVGKRGRPFSQAHVYVGKKHGDGIFVDDPAFLAEWSVDAMKLIRRHLWRAGNGGVPIPGEANWPVAAADTTSADDTLPAWAGERPSGHYKFDDEIVPASPDDTSVTITDLPLMVDEVCDLLDVMEGMMAIQRRRRLDLLRPPSWVRCNWYVLAAVAPPAAYLVGRLVTRGYGKKVVSLFVEKVADFFRERIVTPVVSIFQEVWRGRESHSDKKARVEAIESLKKMIRSWLDDTFPEMPEPDRTSMAEAMDMSMVERKKEESMRTFYEINNVIRMSFIEMQYMKKEMMNALHAMDDMMSANDINMNLAAITPAVLLVYASARVFRLFFYAFLKLGKSREETYASFRHVLTDIERLLVMRDNPPPTHYEYGEEVLTATNKPCVLGSDDLGMLMLLVHECRSILWRDRKRFSEGVIRSVSEDLAELAGERGAVSVQQQLCIVGRMCRTYPFLKVVSIGHLFQYDGLRHV